MIMRITLLAIVFGFGVSPTSNSSPVSARLCPSDPKLATLLAGSSIVLIGKMDVPKQQLTEEAAKPSPGYLDIPIKVESVVKGEDMSSATVRFYPQDATYKPSNAAMLGLAGEPAILFLNRVDDGPVSLYFAGYTPDALKRATDLTVAATRAEASRQAKVVASWRANATLPHFAKVRALIASLGQVDGDQQQHVFDQLEALGNVAVPAIIAQMDDRRHLRTQAISLVNHAPDAFEGMRHYGPEQVVDGLDAVLNQITGESFGSIVNGGSSRQRDAVVAGWRVFAADLACKQDK
ncbi:MAG: hypothetical protein AABZ76_06165 [Pseudomonadota bacterium]|jgi:hypothetical protein|uniref:hypothetical protein n=1 Tax=Sphingobium yanoikuyae TaxID=13690 RepID=UPI00137776D5|nr:hypothetical protein [Sphingobium yanoikuyae]NBB37548.1 hypothetical protein [Sphingobium yanoikuyae]